jgi:hypothetical protein
MIFFLLPLFTHALSDPCEQIENLRSSPNYILCSATSSSLHCSTLQAEFQSSLSSCLLQYSFLATPQSVSDFLTGLYNGIQKDAADPSECVKSFPYIRSSFEEFIFGFKTIGLTPVVTSLFNINLFVNRLSNTYALCNFATLYQVLHPETVWNGVSSLFSHWLLAKAEVSATFSKIFQAFKSENYISGGLYTGKLLTLLTSYSL